MGDEVGGDGVAAGGAADPVTRQRRRPGAAWVSAWATALSAVVAAVALLFGAFGSDDEPTAKLETTVATGPAAPDASPLIGARRSIAIESMAFVADGPGGPVFEFRGRAELNDPDDEEIHVVARPVVRAASDAETWLTSPAAELDRDGSWSTRIAKPPLPDGSFNFAAVIAPTASKTPSTQVGARPLFAASLSVRPSSVRPCSARPTLKESGVKSCLVLDATVVKTYEP